MLGVFGAVMCLQAIRYRAAQPPEAPHPRARAAVVWLAAIVLLAGVIVLIALDSDARHPGSRTTSASSAPESTLTI